ncbi:MAG: hypothetical protein KAH24_03005, partial [Holophagae bacterium]|nr:hypothetical protein [Holophagae bacterium]
MAPGNSIFKTYFILIVLVFHVLVVICGVAWIYLEYQSCIQDAVTIRMEDIGRCRAEAERHLNVFVSRMESRSVTGPAVEISEKEAARAICDEGFGEQGFLFLFFPESGQLAGCWHGGEQLVPLTELCDTSGVPFLRDPCFQCLETGQPQWLNNVSTGWISGHDEWSFYLFPHADRHWVVGAALDMKETTRTADAYMKLSREHILRFTVSMVLFLVAMLLATLGVAFLLARRVTREIKVYAGSLKKALADGTPLEQGSNQLREFRKLAERTNTLLRQRNVAEEEKTQTEEQYRKLFESNAVSI